MTDSETQPTDEHSRPDPPEAPTEGHARPAADAAPHWEPFTRPVAPPPAYPVAPPAAPPPPAYAPPPPAYAPPPPPPPEPTVQGGGGTLWLSPESTVRPVQSPAPPATYLGAPQPQPYPAYQQYPALPIEPSNGKAVASLVLGIVGVLFLVSGFGLAFFINLPCTVLAWIFGVQGKRLVDKGVTTKGDGMAKAGFWMGLIGTIIGVLALAGWIVGIALSA